MTTATEPENPNSPMRHEIRRIGVLSTAKTFLVIGGVGGFVGGLLQLAFFQSLVSYSSSVSMQGDMAGIPDAPDVLGMLGSLAWFLPFIGGVSGAAFGIAGGVLIAVVYNLASRVWGGIELELRTLDQIAKPVIVPVPTRMGESTPLPSPGATRQPAPPPPLTPSHDRPDSPPPASHFFE